jgi:hypothetical protein
MASWFYRGLRRGIVTTRYPKGLDDWANALPSPPAFHSERLTVELADQLVSVCDSGALARTDGTLIVDLGKCTGCGRCVDAAGGAAEPSGEPLLAAVARQALIKLVPIGGGHRRRE